MQEKIGSDTKLFSARLAEFEYVAGELANSKVLVVTYPTRCGFGNDLDNRSATR